MKKTFLVILFTGIFALNIFNLPALASDMSASTEDSTASANATENATADQSATKYFNVQFGDTVKKGLLMMVYQVQDGDKLASIAQKYNISQDVLKYLNQLQDAQVTPGQQIIVAIPQQETMNVTLAPVNKNNDVTMSADSSNKKIDSSNKKVDSAIKNFTPPNIDVNVPADANPRKIDATTKNFTQQELDLLARVAYSEARGESFNGQVAVASVVLNRTKSPLFPKSIAGVIYQPWAFTAVNDGQFNLTPDTNAYLAAKQAMRSFDPTNGALFYWNPTTATSRWVWGRRITGTIGHHVFAI